MQNHKWLYFPHHHLLLLEPVVDWWRHRDGAMRHTGRGCRWLQGIHFDHKLLDGNQVGKDRTGLLYQQVIIFNVFPLPNLSSTGRPPSPPSLPSRPSVGGSPYMSLVLLKNFLGWDLNKYTRPASFRTENHHSEQKKNLFLTIPLHQHRPFSNRGHRPPEKNTGDMGCHVVLHRCPPWCGSMSLGITAAAVMAEVGENQSYHCF